MKRQIADIILIFCGIIAISVTLLAQDSPSTSLFTVKAQSILTSEIYTSSSQDTLWTPRLPPFVGRAILRGTADIASLVSIPFELYYSNRNFGTNQPFNQFGISPRLSDWLTLHAGYFSHPISDFTFGDLRVLGGGIDFHPGNILLSAAYGIIRHERTEQKRDSVLVFPGEYKRLMMSAKLGYDHKNGNYIFLNMMKSWDDTASGNGLTQISPMDNMVASVNTGFSVIHGLTIKGEGAISATNANRSASRLENGFQLPFNIFTPTISSFIDGAAKLSIHYNPQSFWSIKTDAQWVGPGFVTQGFMQLPNDVFDITVSPTLQLFEKTVSVRGSIGIRTNNLRNNRQSATQRIIGMGNISWNYEQWWGIDGSYSNYGINSRHDNDTLRLQNVVQNIVISPRVMFEAWDSYHVINAVFSVQDVNDNNVITQRLTNSAAVSGALTHTITMKNSLNFTTSFMSTDVKNNQLNVSVLNFTETVGYTFIENVLDASVMAGIGSIKTTENENQLLARISANYITNTIGTFSLIFSLNSYDYSSASYNPAFRELLGNFQWVMNF